MLFLDSLLPAPLLLGARQYGTKQDLREKGEFLRRLLWPCPGSATSLCGAALGASGSGRARGRWRCLASCQRLLRSFTPTLLPHGRHFKVLSAVVAPCGALPSRPARVISLSVSEDVTLSGLEILSPKSQKLFAPPRLPLFFFKEFLLCVVWRER